MVHDALIQTVERYQKALKAIAAGQGYYGSQAAEYKKIALEALEPSGLPDWTWPATPVHTMIFGGDMELDHPAERVSATEIRERSEHQRRIQQRADAAVSRVMNDPDIRTQVEALDILQRQVDAQRLAYRIAADTASLVLEMIYAEDAEIRRLREEADRLRKCAEDALSVRAMPIIRKPAPKLVPLSEIMLKRTPRGSWTRAQLAEWGVPWPPPAGWKDALVAGRPMPRHKRRRRPMARDLD